MIVGIGTDLVEIPRIEKILQEKGGRFLKRILTSSEQEKALTSSRPGRSLAKRFAAKEALVKALGTGFQGGVSFQDIEVSHDLHGKPSLSLKGRALEVLEALIPTPDVPSLHLSLSDTAHHALAFVVISKKAL